MADLKKQLILGATGASGLPLLIACLKILRSQELFESRLILSSGARLTLKHETGLSAEDVYALADHIHEPEDIGAKPASGSFLTAGMLIVPCSMKTLAGIHSGYADTLLLRAADVTLKEQRPLVLAVRETPLSPVHLRNMYELSLIPGVRIIPPMMTYYTCPKTVEEMTFQMAARLLEPFGIRTEEQKRWQGL